MSPLALVLGHVARYLALEDLQALLCCQRQPLVSLEMVAQRVAYQAADLLRLIKMAKKSLICQVCCKRPPVKISLGAQAQWCRRCERDLCNQCCSRCARACATQRTLCVECRSVCWVQDCDDCGCAAPTRCACATLVCARHQDKCKRCAGDCCSRCTVALQVPVIDRRYPICPSCAAANRDTLDRCNKLAGV